MGANAKLVGSSSATRTLDGDLTVAAATNAKVLITGESGVGKEIAAQLIHARSARRARPLQTLNCAGLPDSLLESELFGHVRGSFTDAHRDKQGLLQAADGGTVFLDEVGEMTLRMQALLLRFLETGEVQTVGDDRAGKIVDVRIVCATNRSLRQRIASGDFREDLFYRLNVIHVHIPPLRERQDDIRDLVLHFAARYAESYNLPTLRLTPDAWERVLHYHWPGNVRELKNVVERLVVRPRGEELTIDDLPHELQLASVPLAAHEAAAGPTLDETVARRLFCGMISHRESFWTAVYTPFRAHDVTRDTLRRVVSMGLRHTQGRYSALIPLFNMQPSEYKRFLGALRKHDCFVPYHRFRAGRPMNEDGPSEDVRLA
jgi:DNA-binding NtrC family response regulator